MRTERIRISAAAALFLTLPTLWLCRGQSAEPIPEPPNLGTGLDAVAAGILPFLRGDSPFLVSPDSRQLLIKTEIETGRSELRLEDLETRRTLGRYVGEYPLLIDWRPHTKWLSFVEDDRKVSNYRLRFWNPDDGEVIVPAAPGMPLANRFFRWSPDGRFLALPIPIGGGRDQLQLLDAERPFVKAATVFEAAGISDFDWSPDGSCLAVLAAESAGAVVLIDRGDGDRIRRVMVSPGAILRQLAWSPNGRQLLVACRDSNQTAYGLRSVDLESGNSVVLEAPVGNVALTARAALAGGRYLFNIEQDGLSTLMLGAPGAPGRPVGFDDGTTSLLAVDQRRGDLFVAHKGVVQPNALYCVPLGGGRPALVYQNGFGQALPAAPPERVAIPVSDGSSLPVYVWRAGPRPSRGVVIAFPFVRTAPLDITFDAGRQYIVKRGYDYVMFKHRPTTDFGKDWASRISESDVASALAVVDYARRTLGAPPDKVVLFGFSNGTVYVARTAARMRDKRGGLLLRSAVYSIQSMGKISDHHFKIAGIHGEYDPFPAKDAKAQIERIFGPDSLGGSRGFWRIMEGEAHSPVFIRSKALINAALLQLLDAPPEPPERP